MVFAAGPNWLGSPQHFVGGLVLAVVVLVLARHGRASFVLSSILAIGITSFVEVAIELVEYPTEHSGHLHPTGVLRHAGRPGEHRGRCIRRRRARLRALAKAQSG